MNPLSDILNSFESASFSSVANVSDTNRFETKFILNTTALPDLLEELKQNYLTLRAGESPTTEYTTLYYDTPTFKLYLDHHNHRADRFKVRQRTYLEAAKTWLELKYGTGAGRTIKERSKRASQAIDLTGNELDFLASRLPFHPSQLLPTLSTRYTRITLLNKTEPERVTIDLDLKFSKTNKIETPKGLVILEIKGVSRQNGPAFLALKKRALRPMALSKYCLGINYLYPELKKNNFKPRLLAIDKLIA